MRTIDADDLIERCERVIEHGIPNANGEHIISVECVMKNIKAMPTIEPELVWHECFDEDPASFPDNERNVLVSFSNFSLSILGQWRVDEDGAGCWYLGNTDETFLSEDLYVDGWWELPKKPEGRE